MKGIVELQLDFAKRISEITQTSFSQTVFEYTQFIHWLELGEPKTPENPEWQTLMQTLKKADDPAAWAKSYIFQRNPPPATNTPRPPFGCFSYGVWADGRIRLHFSANDPDGNLGHTRQAERISELKGLFTEIKQTVPDAKVLRGGSWMYNIEAYRRLFPPAYLDTAVAFRGEWQFLSLWGQFVDSNRQIKPNMAEPFRACLQQQTDLDAILECFPYFVLRLESSIEHFYDFYNIS